MKKGWVIGAVAVVGLGLTLAYLDRSANPRTASGESGPLSTSRSPTTQKAAVKSDSSASQGQQSSPQPSTARPLETQSFGEILRLAEQGNPAAQRALSDRYSDCSAYSLSPTRFKANVEATAKMASLPKATVDRVTAIADTLCTDVDGGQPIPHEAVNLWLEQSAKNGDLIAKVKLAAKAPAKLKPTDANQLISDVIASGDPNALLELASLTGRLDDSGIDPKYREYVGGGPNDEYAWALAACRNGAACGADSRIMKLVCINTMRCSYNSYEQFVLTEMIPQGGKKRAEQIAKALEQNFIN